MDTKSTKWNYHPLFKTLIFILMLVFLYFSVLFSVKSFQHSNTSIFSNYYKSYRFSKRFSEILDIISRNDLNEPETIKKRVKLISNNFKYSLVDENLNLIVGSEKEFNLNSYLENPSIIITDLEIYDIYEKHAQVSNVEFSIFKYYDLFKKFLQEPKTILKKVSSNKRLYISTGREDLVKNGSLKSLVQLDMEQFQREKNTTIISTTMFFLLVILTIMCFFYLSSTIGYRNKDSKVYLIWFDYIPFEIQLIGTFATIYVSYQYSRLLTSDFESFLYIFRLYMSVIGLVLFTYFSWVRKIKAKSFVEYSIFPKLTVKTISLLGDAITSMLPTNWKNYHNTFTILYQFIYVALNLLFIIIAYISYKSNFYLILALSISIIAALNIYVAYNVAKFMQELKKIVDYIADIKKGLLDNYIDSKNYSEPMSEVVENLNLLSIGIKETVDKQTKSERMRTDLITNVSHDLKTPLTSIINYVDLLSKEDINTDEASKYVNILKKQSNRLKSLINQLLDASKFESGNVNLNIKIINIDNFMSQISGEYSESFAQKNLELIYQSKIENSIIETDSDLLYRLLDNLLSNAKKYSLENTRVYANVFSDEDNRIFIELKNTSKYPLNISSDELMARFVRSDSSRASEGNGLGLAIARSIAKLLGIKFDIFIDGDLFKVVLVFDSNKKLYLA